MNAQASVLPLHVARGGEMKNGADASSATNARAMFLLSEIPFEIIYGSEERQAIETDLGKPTPFLSPEAYFASDTIWPSVEYLFSGWGMVTADLRFLERFPSLRAIFYGAGSVKSIVTEPFWKRGIALSSAVSINAIPVAEFTLSQILYALKRGWQHVFELRQHRRFERLPSPGAYQSVVGLIGLGEIGRGVAKRLDSFDTVVIAYDPYFSRPAAKDLGITLVSLDEIFARSDVVSCHAPLLPGTVQMIQPCHFEAMKPNSSFINTARGEVVDEEGMISVLRRRPDLCAILDVTAPEPPRPTSPLYELENVILTPHIAGSNDAESRRMGNFMVREFNRFLRGQPLLGGITPAMLEFMA